LHPGLRPLAREAVEAARKLVASSVSRPIGAARPNG
jgi:hypothetical protein